MEGWYIDGPMAASDQYLLNLPDPPEEPVRVVVGETPLDVAPDVIPSDGQFRDARWEAHYYRLIGFTRDIGHDRKAIALYEYAPELAPQRHAA